MDVNGCPRAVNLHRTLVFELACASEKARDLAKYLCQSLELGSTALAEGGTAEIYFEIGMAARSQNAVAPSMELNVSLERAYAHADELGIDTGTLQSRRNCG